MILDTIAHWLGLSGHVALLLNLNDVLQICIWGAILWMLLAGHHERPMLIAAVCILAMIGNLVSIVCREGGTETWPLAMQARQTAQQVMEWGFAAVTYWAAHATTRGYTGRERRRASAPPQQAGNHAN